MKTKYTPVRLFLVHSAMAAGINLKDLGAMACGSYGTLKNRYREPGKFTSEEGKRISIILGWTPEQLHEFRKLCDAEVTI